MYTTAYPSSSGNLANVLIVDDHPLYSDALASTLQLGFGTCRFHTAASLQAAFALLDAGVEPDLIVLDLKLPDVAGISGFERLRQRRSDARILVISSMASPELVQSLIDRGAMGFLPKESSAATLRHAVDEIASGRRYVPKEYRSQHERADSACRAEASVYHSNPQLAQLTPQQTRILKQICAGKPNKQIAYELSLAEATVKAHITALLRRLSVRNRTQAAVLVEGLAAQHGGMEPEVRAFLNN
jgi:DNA-binding NarL/FixJ family response regulator